MEKRWGVWKKLHRWPGLIISFVLFYYAITGIFLNHREFFSSLDINRSFLPESYAYKNWNNAALKGNLIINSDSILVFGNIGIWLTDSGFNHYKSFNYGLPDGSDNRKIFDVHLTQTGDLYAATLFGLFAYNSEKKKWEKFDLNTQNNRFTAIESIDDTVFAMSRSHLFKGISQGVYTSFEKIELSAPDNYVNDVTLFQTIWQIHSGEIFGLPGKLFVDILGLITAFLSLTGIIYFFFPGWIKNRKRINKSSIKLVNVNKWALKWHNFTGAWTFVPLIILFFAGIFLRPPLLIAIAYARIAPLKFSHLDQPNPWHDKLRDLIYNDELGIFLLSTADGTYYMGDEDLKPRLFKIQPPVSVMGVNTFEKYGDHDYLIGSFSGLFLWNPLSAEIYDATSGTIYSENISGRPIGEYKVTGTITDFNGNKYLLEYDKGAIPLNHNRILAEMPDNIIKESKISLWNFSLEVHTGRIFQGIFGIFYILLVPLTGLAGIIVVLSGYIIYKRKYK